MISLDSFLVLKCVVQNQADESVWEVNRVKCIKWYDCCLRRGNLAVTTKKTQGAFYRRKTLSWEGRFLIFSNNLIEQCTNYTQRKRESKDCALLSTNKTSAFKANHPWMNENEEMLTYPEHSWWESTCQTHNNLTVTSKTSFYR